MRNPRVLCNIHGNSPSYSTCIFHKTLGLMLYLLHTTVFCLGYWTVHIHYSPSTCLLLYTVYKVTCIYTLIPPPPIDGFRKVSHPEEGALIKAQVNETLEFWHTNFRRGHHELLHLVQRKVRPCCIQAIFCMFVTAFCD